MMTMMPSIFGEHVFDDFFDGFSRKERMNPMMLMKTDIKDTEAAYELEIELPGVQKEDVKAQLDNGYLTIQAQYGSNKEEKDENGKYIRRERYSGSTSRRFYVGNRMKQEDIKAKFENGILKLVLPKPENKPEIEEKKYIAIEG